MLKYLNDILSFVLELGMLAALAYAGFHFGTTKPMQYVLAISLPGIVIIFWAKYMAPRAEKRLPFPWLALVTFLLFEASAAALYFSHKVTWAAVLGLASLVNIGLKIGYELDRAANKAPADSILTDPKHQHKQGDAKQYDHKSISGR